MSLSVLTTQSGNFEPEQILKKVSVKARNVEKCQNKSVGMTVEYWLKVCSKNSEGPPPGYNMFS